MTLTSEGMAVTIVEYSDGGREVSDPAWTWNTEDVLFVLKIRGLVDEDADDRGPFVQRAFDASTAQPDSAGGTRLL